MVNDKAVRRLGAVSSVLCAALFFVIIPIDVVSYNATNFVRTTLEFFVSGAKYAAPLALAGWLFFRFAPLWLARPTSLVATVGAVYLWVYGLAVSAASGMLTGTVGAVVLTSPFGKWEIPLLVAVAVLLCAACWFKPKVMGAFITFVLIGLGAQTAFQVVHYHHKALPGAGHPEIALRFSTERNVLVILLDGLQSDVFDQTLKEIPDLRDTLQGFTFFPNALSHAPSTYLSLPTIHSGEVPTRENLRSFFIDNIQKNSFLVDLKRAGYETTVANPLKNTCPDGVDYCGSYEPGKSSQVEVGTVKNLAQFRITPFFAKYSPDRIGKRPTVDPNANLRPLINNITAEKIAPTAKLIHLLNTHPPFSATRDCGLAAAIDVTADTALEHTICVMSAIKQMIAKMKALGIYDNTHMVIVADHGLGSPSRYLLDELRGNGMPANSVAALALGDLNNVFYRANPALLVKPAGNHQPFAVDPKLVAVSQIRATICQLTKECSADLGPSLLTPEAELGWSRFVAYHWNDMSWDADVVPKARVYTLTGPSWRFQSWQTSDAPEIEVGQTINLRGGGIFNTPSNPLWSNLGWSFPEPTGMSTKDAFASLFLEMPIGLSANQLVMKTTAHAYTALQHPFQNADVYINGHWVDHWSIKHGEGDQVFTTYIPPAILESPAIRLDIRPLNPTAPKDAGLSEDTRALGMTLREFRFEAFKPGPSYTLGETVRMSDPAMRARYYNRGWSPPEYWGAWIAGVDALFVLPLATPVTTPVFLRGRVQGYTSESHPQQDMEILVNGTSLAKVTFARESPSWDFSLPVPSALLASGRAVVEFRAPNPAMLGGGVGEFRLEGN